MAPESSPEDEAQEALPLEGVPAPQESEDWTEGLTPEEREAMARWSLCPPRWVLIVHSVLAFVLAGVAAVVIMLQWVVWFAATSGLFQGWGILIGGMIALAQIFMIFLRSGGKKESCHVRVSSGHGYGNPPQED